MELSLICSFENSSDKNKYLVGSIWKSKCVEIIIIGDDTVWMGEINEDNCSRFLKTLGIDFKNYCKTFKLLFQTDSCKDFKLSFENNVFSWSKIVNSDLSILNGTIDFIQVTGSDIVKKVLKPIVDSFSKLKEENQQHKNEISEIKSELKSMADNFKKCNDLKQEMEQTLYVKFLAVLKKRDDEINALKKQLEGKTSNVYPEVDMNEDNIEMDVPSTSLGKKIARSENNSSSDMEF